MIAAEMTAEPMGEIFARFARRNVETCLLVAEQFCRWHRKLLLAEPTPQELREHDETARGLLLMLRMLEAAAGPGSPVADLGPEIESAAAMINGCWDTLHKPLSEPEAESILHEAGLA